MQNILTLNVFPVAYFRDSHLSFVIKYFIPTIVFSSQLILTLPDQTYVTYDIKKIPNTAQF